jgi:membrane protein YqaA with SNARE-associated domain
MEHYLECGYLGLFVSSFLAATIIPLSSEIVLSILLANDYNFITSLSIATLGNWLGGLSSYVLGRLGNWNYLGKYFGVEQTKVKALKNKIDRWGSPLAFLCWVPLIGDVLAVGLGFFRVSLHTVAIWMLVGKVVRYFAWGVLTLWGISLF